MLKYSQQAWKPSWQVLVNRSTISLGLLFLFFVCRYGDWIDPSGTANSAVTPSGSVTAFYYVMALGQMSEIATALGNTTAATTYGIKHNQGIRAYHARFYNDTIGG